MPSAIHYILSCHKNQKSPVPQSRLEIAWSQKWDTRNDIIYRPLLFLQSILVYNTNRSSDKFFITLFNARGESLATTSKEGFSNVRRKDF